LRIEYIRIAIGIVFVAFEDGSAGAGKDGRAVQMVVDIVIVILAGFH